MTQLFGQKHADEDDLKHTQANLGDLGQQRQYLIWSYQIWQVLTTHRHTVYPQSFGFTLQVLLIPADVSLERNCDQRALSWAGDFLHNCCLICNSENVLKTGTGRWKTEVLALGMCGWRKWVQYLKQDTTSGIHHSGQTTRIFMRTFLTEIWHHVSVKRLFTCHGHNPSASASPFLTVVICWSQPADRKFCNDFVDVGDL